MKDLPLYKPDIGVYEQKPLSEIVPRLDEQGLELLEVLLQSDPSKRITAAEAMNHPFLADVIS